MEESVQAWFDRRLSRAADWPVSTLLDAKGDSSVAVVLPALNEEATVGRIVERIRRELVVRNALVDELVVVDSGSTDRTAVVAAEAGARVVAREDVLPDLPPYDGKGEALWRSLAATTSDVVVFVDSDLRDFSTTFVTGLLGPLLTDPTVQFVKATYDRPLQTGETVIPAGGGRVTELVARPLINMYWPELAGFVQPLGGEYAARRSLLEQLPFPCGYGVELGLLVDTWRTVGLDAMAQVDLAKRKHRNQSNEKLGRMSAEIMQVAINRLESDGRLKQSAPPSTMLTQFERDGDGYRIHDVDMTEHERPPMVQVIGEIR
ncbi:MAG: glucosyl-3-phosphoglycerate synthase [Frankiales bacterium]|nr:glucosyl-3-phosphoglycerate synthase [Frankiales bacterium]